MNYHINVTIARGWLAAIALMLLILPVAAQPTTGPRLTFVKDKHEFGDIPVDTITRDTAIYLDVLFTNTGDEPLTINSVNACCGTELINRPQEPINPGDTATIQLSLTLRPRIRTFLRAITVYSNSSDRPAIVFPITGTVTYGHKP